MSRSRSTVFAMLTFSDRCENPQKSSHTFSRHLQPFQRCQRSIFLKCKSRSHSTIIAMTSFDYKCHNLQTSFFSCLIFAKIRHVITMVTYTDRHRHRETGKAMAIGEVADLTKTMYLTSSQASLTSSSIFE